MAPSEFWGLTPAEFWLIHEYRRSKDPNDYAGSLDEDTVADLYEMLDGD